jgi:hypothetical protein
MGQTTPAKRRVRASGQGLGPRAGRWRARGRRLCGARREVRIRGERKVLLVRPPGCNAAPAGCRTCQAVTGRVAMSASDVTCNMSMVSPTYRGTKHNLEMPPELVRRDGVMGGGALPRTCFAGKPPVEGHAVVNKPRSRLRQKTHRPRPEQVLTSMIGAVSTSVGMLRYSATRRAAVKRGCAVTFFKNHLRKQK